MKITPVLLAAFLTVQAAAPGRAGAVVPNPDWQAVTAEIETGGEAYLVLSLDNAMESVLQRIENLALIAEQDSMRPGQAAQMMSILRAVVDVTGFHELDDVGASVVTLEDGSRRARVYLHLNEVRGLFRVRGGEPRTDSEALAMIPREAVYAMEQELDVAALMEVIDEAVVAGAGQMGKSELDLRLQQLRDGAGVDVRAIVASLDGQFAAWMSLDEPVAIPAAGRTLMIPRPDFCLMAKTNGDSPLFDAIKRLADSSGKVVEETASPAGGRMLVLPAQENPFGLKPVVAEIGDWVVFASNLGALQASMTAGSAGTLETNEDFARLAAGTPSAANSFSFVSPRMNDSLQSILAQVAEADPAGARRMAPAMQLLGLQDDGEPGFGTLTVRVNKPDGILWVTQGDVHTTDAFKALAMPALPVLAAIAVPNFLEAQVRSKVARTRSDMRTMATALEAYMIDNSKYPAWTLDPALNARKSGEVPSFRLWPEGTTSYQGLHMTLTSPIAYFTSMPEDVFAKDGGPFGYYVTPVDPATGQHGNGWILFSPGPDGDYDLQWELLRPDGLQANSEWLLPATYDPTNGTVSDGDIWRTNN